MKLALFSSKIQDSHLNELKKFFNKNLSDVKVLYITTASNYKPFLPDWSVETENKLRSIFPDIHEFDFERAFKVDNRFNFTEYLSNFDFIFIGGGNTFLLSFWIQKTGARDILRYLIDSEQIVYGGESAGTIYTYKNIAPCEFIDDPEIASGRVDKGLDIVDFVTIPHWNNPDFQNKLEKVKNEYQLKDAREIYEITDEQALFYSDNQVRII